MQTVNTQRFLIKVYRGTALFLTAHEQEPPFSRPPPRRLIDPAKSTRADGKRVEEEAIDVFFVRGIIRATAE